MRSKDDSECAVTIGANVLKVAKFRFIVLWRSGVIDGKTSRGIRAPGIDRVKKTEGGAKSSPSWLTYFKSNDNETW